MARKRRKFEMNLPAADRYISDLKYKDLKRECVIRGLDFFNVVNFGIPGLSNWLRGNFDNPTDHKSLDAFDSWQEAQVILAMEAKGQDPNEVLHPALRLGYIAETDADGNVTKRKRVSTVIKRKKKKRERTEQGIFQGTKKAFTYNLQQQGLSKEEVTKKVLEEYPDASEKSISIWFNKSRKLQKS